MINKKHLEFLIRHKTKDHYHSNRCLFDHYVGTYNILSSWDNCDVINCAGLFHSFYGIKRKYNKPERFYLQQKVQSIIGVSSEHLVYLFCSLDKVSYLNQKFEKLNKWEHQALIEIEAANIIEQEPYINSYFNNTIQYIKQIENIMYLLSPKGCKAYKKFLRKIKF